MRDPDISSARWSWNFGEEVAVLAGEPRSGQGVLCRKGLVVHQEEIDVGGVVHEEGFVT